MFSLVFEIDALFLRTIGGAIQLQCTHMWFAFGLFDNAAPTTLIIQRSLK
jgi:hypothetical protein